MSGGSHPLGTLFGSPASSLKLMICHNNFCNCKKREGSTTFQFKFSRSSSSHHLVYNSLLPLDMQQSASSPMSRMLCMFSSAADGTRIECAGSGRGFNSHPVHFYLLSDYGIKSSSILGSCRTKPTSKIRAKQIISGLHITVQNCIVVKEA